MPPSLPHYRATICGALGKNIIGAIRARMAGGSPSTRAYLSWLNNSISAASVSALGSRSA